MQGAVEGVSLTNEIGTVRCAMLCCVLQVMLGLTDAGYSGDWSRIGAITKGIATSKERSHTCRLYESSALLIRCLYACLAPAFQQLVTVSVPSHTTWLACAGDYSQGLSLHHPSSPSSPFAAACTPAADQELLLQQLAVIAWSLHGVCGLITAKIASSKGRNPAVSFVKVSLSSRCCLQWWLLCALPRSVGSTCLWHAYRRFLQTSVTCKQSAGKLSDCLLACQLSRRLSRRMPPVCTCELSGTIACLPVMCAVLCAAGCVVWQPACFCGVGAATSGQPASQGRSSRHTCSPALRHALVRRPMHGYSIVVTWG
jgi:hypothetical protein